MNGRTLIKNGTVVMPDGAAAGSVLIQDGKIEAVGRSLASPDAKVIDADGCLVLPGGVDVHTHLNLKLGDRRVSDGFYAGSVAAAFGGTTSFVDHPEAGPDGCSLFHQPEFYRDRLEKEAVVDFGVHGVFQEVNETVLDEVAGLVDAGYSSLKVYMTYANRLLLDETRQVQEAARKAHGLLAYHAEEHETITRLQAEYGDQGLLAPIYHARSRPASCEAESIEQIVGLVEKTGAPAYIVHLSSAAGLEVTRKARKAGLPVYVETCPQYLVLEEKRYEEPDGLKYIMAPPLRSAADAAALWEGLADGSIDVVGTDHCSFSLADKQKFWQGDFRLAPGGCPGVETRLMLLYSEGVRKGRLSLERFVEVMAANPAQIMGLHPRKGNLLPGADADVVIWDPNHAFTLTTETLHQKVDYTPYEGLEVVGKPRLTLLRGQVIVNGDKFTGRRGGGRFVPRSRFQGFAI